MLLAALTPLLLNIDPLTYFLKRRNTECPSSYTLLISYSSGRANNHSVNCLVLLRFKTFTESFTMFWWQVLVHRSLREPLDSRQAVTKRHQPRSGDPKGPDIKHPLRKTVNKTSQAIKLASKGYRMDFSKVGEPPYIFSHMCGCERIFWPRPFFYEISILSIILFQKKIPPS